MRKVRKALVTGAGGFIGSHLVERLVAEGVDVVAFVRYGGRGEAGWLDHSSVRDKVHIHYGDIRDMDSVRVAMQGCDTVYHLAALIGIPYSYESPLAYVRTNVEGTYNVVQCARDYGVECVVHTSTSEVYGTAQFVPITEQHPLVGQSPYSASKIGADQLALSFFLSFSTPVTILRPFNTYGPRQSTRAVIPTIIAQLLKDGRLRLGSLDPTRDFNFVTDTVGAFWAASRVPAALGQVINAGSNYEVSIADTATTIAEFLGVKLDITQESERIRPENSEVNRLWAANQKAKDLLGWSPQYAGIDGFRRGLQDTIAWFSDSKNLAKYRTERYHT